MDHWISGVKPFFFKLQKCLDRADGIISDSSLTGPNNIYIYIYIYIYIRVKIVWTQYSDDDIDEKLTFTTRCWGCVFLIYILSRDGSRRRGGGNDTPHPVELTLSRSQKVTVRREWGSRRCSHLSDLGSPDIGRGKKNEAKWLAGGRIRKWGSLPLSGSKRQKGVFEQVWWQTDDSHFTPG